MPHAEDALENITRSHARASTLRARAFFVAWNGVLTMAYEGWTEGVARYKRALNDPEVGLERRSARKQVAEDISRLFARWRPEDGGVKRLANVL